LGSSDKVANARRLRRELPFARDKIGNLNAFKPLPMAAFSPIKIGNVDWAIIVDALASSTPPLPNALAA
jgi:hypothetical protein